MNATLTAEPQLSPSFLGSLRGIWLLTWRTQFVWRKLPGIVLGLLVLPALIYLTISLPQAWAESHSIMGRPALPYSDLTSQLQRHGGLPSNEVRRQMLQIFNEEFHTTDAEVNNDTSPSATTLEFRNEHVKACYDRIETRLEPLLNEQQMKVFRAFKARNLISTGRRLEHSPWSWDRNSSYYHWLIDLYFFVLLPINCVRACGALVRDELQADTLGFLLTRPLKRAALVITKYLAQTAWLQILAVVQLGLIFATGHAREVHGLLHLLPWFLVLQFFAVLAWSALGTLLGLFTARYMAMALVYGLIVEMGIGRIPTNINTLSVMRHLKTLLAQNSTLEAIFQYDVTGSVKSFGFLLLAPVVFLTLALLLFTFREYHHTSEMQK